MDGGEYVLRTVKGSYVTRPKNVLGMNYLFEVRSNISHFMKVALDGKSFNKALQYKTDTKFIEALEDGLLADNQAIKAINENAELVDEYHSFYTQTKGTLAEFLSKGLAKWLDGLPPGLKSDIGDINSDLGRFFANAIDKKRAELVDAWKILDDAGYAALKKNPANLEKVSSLLKNSKLVDAGLDEGMVSRLIKGNRNAGGSAAALDDLTKGLDDLVSSGTKFEDIGKLVTDLEKGGNFAEGAGWIQRYITSNVNEFSGKTLIFESVEKAGETVRRVDVKMPDGNITRYFEFKSVSEIPPTNFATQFVKDMQISDVSDLGQIKWLFDGKKVSSLENSVDDFINSLDEIDIPQSVINKFTPGSIKTKDALLDAIENRFNDIFKVK